MPGRMRKVGPLRVARAEWQGLRCPFASRDPLASPGALPSGEQDRGPTEGSSVTQTYTVVCLLNLGVSCTPPCRPPGPWGPLRLSPSSPPGFWPLSRVPNFHTRHFSPSPPIPFLLQLERPGPVLRSRARTPWNPCLIPTPRFSRPSPPPRPPHPSYCVPARARDLRGCSGSGGPSLRSFSADAGICLSPGLK